MADNDYYPEPVRGRNPSPRARWMRRELSWRRILTWSVLGTVSGLVVVLVMLSPLVINHVGLASSLNWPLLSNIGQTYGAASALLTALALIGIAGSLIFQVRAIRVSRDFSSREHHAHLIEMALSDEVYQRAWGVNQDIFAPDEFRQKAYLNLIFSYWEQEYLHGALDDRSARYAIDGIFDGEAARLWWRQVRGNRMVIGPRRLQRFCGMVNEAFEIADASGPPQARAAAAIPANAGQSQPHAHIRGTLKAASAMLLGVLGGALAARLMRRR